tara:strand:- start:5705 stop:5971 length:267 start_codon:yes stop_codon:yes gene_type:complete
MENYKSTPEFDECSIPPGLLKAHQTKPGVWGKIVVLSGRLKYRILEPVLEEVELSAQLHGVVEPAVPHEVEPIGAVKFYVAFYRERAG